MSNIRGFGDFNDAAPAGGASGQGQPGPGQGFEAEGNIGIGLTPPSAMGMIPSISERLVPRFNVKSFTFIVSVVDVLVFIATLVYAGVHGKVFDENNAMAGPSGTILGAMGGKFYPCIYAGQVWRLVTPIFLHAGIIHLVSNLFFQLHFGFTFETRWGWRRFATVYMLTGVGASLLSSVTSPEQISVGASGALFGLLGADAVYLFMNWVDIPQNKGEACVLTFVIVINFILGFSKDGEIDNMAHLGGLITGIFCGAFICPPLNYWPKTRLYQGIGAFLFVVFLVTLVLLIFLQKLTTVTCPW